MKQFCQHHWQTMVQSREWFWAGRGFAQIKSLWRMKGLCAVTPPSPTVWYPWEDELWGKRTQCRQALQSWRTACGLQEPVHSLLPTSFLPSIFLVGWYLFSSYPPHLSWSPGLAKGFEEREGWRCSLPHIWKSYPALLRLYKNLLL